MHPGNDFDLELIKSLINKAYWPIYGDMKILEEISEPDDSCIDEDYSCTESTGKSFSYVALMIYMVIANVLLINLLIAMFRHVFYSLRTSFKHI